MIFRRISGPLYISGACPVAQTVKNWPVMADAQVASLGQEDPLEKGKATHSGILACRILYMNHTVHGVAEPDTTEWLSLSPCRGPSFCPQLWLFDRQTRLGR